MSQLTEHELYSIEDKIHEWWKDVKIAEYIHRDKSVISRLFARYPREGFSALFIISDRFKKKSIVTSHHTRIEPWGELEKYILSKIKKRWSPEQITESWKKDKNKRYEQEICKPNCCNKEKLHSQERLSKDTLYTWVYTHHSDLVKKYFRRKWKKYRNRKRNNYFTQISTRYRIGEWLMSDRK